MKRLDIVNNSERDISDVIDEPNIYQEAIEKVANTKSKI